MISIEQPQSQEKTTNTEVETDYEDVLFDVPEKPNEKFDQRLYQNAQNYVALNWQQMTAGELDDFSQYSAKLEAGFHNKTAEKQASQLELENDPNLSTEDMAEIFNIYEKYAILLRVNSTQLLRIEILRTVHIS